jgi:hypothetical protein
VKIQKGQKLTRGIKTKRNKTRPGCVSGCNSGRTVILFYFLVTLPRGDIVLEYGGDPLHILCILNNSHSAAADKNSSDMVFFVDDSEVPQEFVRVVNSTTIEVHIEKPAISSSMYYCKLKDTPREDEYTAVCLNKVIVDSK